MQIERKGSGPWADVAVDGVTVKISVGDESRQFDCAALQQDMQVEVDVVMGDDGHLAEGAANGSEYVANLIIPPKRYADVDLPMPLTAESLPAEQAYESGVPLAGNEEPLPDDIDPQSITPAPVVETVPVPLEEEEMEAVRLILWTVNPVNTEMEMF